MLYSDLKAWEYMRSTPNMRVCSFTWAFKWKPHPDGKATKLKARFVVRGDHQVKGVDYFQTWAPVCHWSTIHTMIIIAAKENLCSAQCDITADFLHAKFPNNEHIYVNHPWGFKDNIDYVLLVKCSLYGLKQSPRYLPRYLSARLEKHGLVHSLHDPCLFLSKDVIAIVYVDDLLI